MTKIASGLLALTFLLSACSIDGAPGDGATPGGDVPPMDDVQALGGDAAVDAIDELYEAAIEAGQTTVTVYGPGETDKQSIYDELFLARFPEISVTGVYLLGPDYAARLEGEFASGQHVADLVQAGDTSISPGLPQDYYEAFRPVTASEMDQSSYSDANGMVWAASGTAFGHMYNTTQLAPADAPQGWEDLLDPALAGRITTDDVARNGAGFGTLSHLLWDGTADTEYIEGLAAQDIVFQASSPASGNAVATGEYALQSWYPMPFYIRDQAAGAPVEYVFPTEGGVHISPHYLGVVNGAPNPEAAKLLMTWLFTPEAQQAMAEIGYYPLVPGQPGVPGYPPIDDLDLLKPFSLTDLNAINAENLEIIQSAFAN
ncbi:ABC transporter substrate-binding protein [Microbacterium halotolerans]|uniref:ABC transporter substrate-binding protein n=1 Tax=Microbacterium halotolerans TaxID=246613 RepID=UPI0013C2E95A|nr:extracellular solute-binding protein [Microbacterium halotolerans]